VRRTNGRCGYICPFRIVPATGQAPEYSIKASCSQCPNILHNDERWSNFANETVEFIPKAAAPSIKAFTLARDANVLAGKPSAYDIDGNSIGSKSGCCEFFNVMIARHLWPVFRQHAARKLFDLAKCDSFKAARALQSKREPADTAE